MNKSNYNHLDELTTNKFYNLNSIRRYSSIRLIQEETDSQHTISMQLLAMFFYDKYPKMNIRNIVYRILTHDLDEALSGNKHGTQVECFGDIPSVIKFYNDEAYNTLREATEQTMYDNLDNKAIYKDVTKSKYDFSTKEKASESAFVNILDSLQVILKLRDEMHLQNGNHIIALAYENGLNSFYKKLNSEFVKPYMQHGFWKDIYDEMLEYYDEFLEEYYKLKR